MDLSTSAYIDSSGAKMIMKLNRDLTELSIMFHIAEAHSEVRDMLKREDVNHLFGHVSHRDSLHDTVMYCLQEHQEWEKEIIKSQDEGVWHA